MILRLRSLETKQTQRIEVPNTCNLPQLKQQIISLQLVPPSSQTNLLFSLNRKDELCGPTPDSTLQSLGVTSGDLIYYSLNPLALSSVNPSLSLAQMGISPDNEKGVNFVVESGNLGEIRSAQMGGLSNLSENSEVDGGLGGTHMVESCKLGEFVVSSGETSDLRSAQMEGLSKLSENSEVGGDLGGTHMVESCKLGEAVGSGEGNGELVSAQMDGLSELGGSSDHTGDLVDTQMVGSENLVEGDGSNVRVDTLMRGSAELVEGDVANARGQVLGDDQMGGSSNPNDGESVEATEGVDEMEVDDESVNIAKTRFSVPSFLKKVFVMEVGDAAANGGNHKLLVIAVHAVLLESGFVGYDPVSGMKVDGFHLPDEWPSSSFGISLHYTLPVASTSEVVETVLLKFQNLGKYVNVYGSLPKKGFGVHRVCLDEPRFVPALSYVWKNYTNSQEESDGSRKLYPNREIFDFWKIVKDGISYPLLIELCEHLCFVPPPCFMRLPTELKLKILESLPAVDVASMGCVSSELRFIASNNDLWRLKYGEEFGNAAESQREYLWKAKFSSAWETRKKRKRLCAPMRWREPRPMFPRRWNPQPQGLPFIIGGDYDRLPGFGIPQPGPRIFRTNCDLGLGGFGI